MAKSLMPYTFQNFCLPSWVLTSGKFLAGYHFATDAQGVEPAVSSGKILFTSSKYNLGNLSLAAEKSNKVGLFFGDSSMKIYFTADYASATQPLVPTYQATLANTIYASATPRSYMLNIGNVFGLTTGEVDQLTLDQSNNPALKTFPLMSWWNIPVTPMVFDDQIYAWGEAPDGSYALYRYNDVSQSFKKVAISPSINGGIVSSYLFDSTHVLISTVKNKIYQCTIDLLHDTAACNEVTMQPALTSYILQFEQDNAQKLYMLAFNGDIDICDAAISSGKLAISNCSTNSEYQKVAANLNSSAYLTGITLLDNINS